jgi:two-component system chemotaxis response regulator CheY
VSPKQYILCVDDEQAVLNQLSAQLARSFGLTHLVECTESAEEALGLMDEIFGAGDEVQLVICDQVMPGMKGDRFLEAVNRAHPEIMKVLLTGQAGLDSAIYAINHAGLHRYIEKPWQAEDLNLTIQNLLTQYRLLRDLDRYHQRLERRSRELHSLHQLGLALGGAAAVERVLSLARDAARSLAGARNAAAVAAIGRKGAPSWSLHPTASLDAAARAGIEAVLVRLRSEGGSELPQPLPFGWQAVAIRLRDALFGWLLLEGAVEHDPDVQDLLQILAGQTAATLNSLQLLEERVESERASTIGRMIQTIVHDFRNPMTAIKGYSGMIEEVDLPRAKQQECARLILEEADRMNLMIEEILEYARGGRTSLALTRTTVDELAAKVRRLMEPEFQDRGIAFRTELAYAGQLTLDVERMKRAILNIASNALDAMTRGGTFTFGSRLDDGMVDLTFSDTGHGIPQALQPRIFEPFFTHGKVRGIGLGMAITRKIVEEHGGQIHLESREGHGTCFTMRLPLQPAVRSS